MGMLNAKLASGGGRRSMAPASERFHLHLYGQELFVLPAVFYTLQNCKVVTRP